MQESNNNEYPSVDSLFWAKDVYNSFIRLILKERNLTPIQIRGLANALYAVQRLPMVTEGINCTYGISLTNGNEEYSEMRYCELFIGEEYIEVSKGGSVYEKGLGSDSFSLPGYYLQIDGYEENSDMLIQLEDELLEMVNMGGEISVEDYSEINMEEDE